MEKNIRFEKETYKLLQEAECCVGAEVINQGLESARKILKVEPLARYASMIPFDGIFCYEGNEINACSNREGGTYYIAFSYGFFVEIFNWLNMWMQAPAIQDVFEFENDEIRNIFKTNVYNFIIMFTVAHEFFHILDGHCDIPENEDHFMADGAKRLQYRDRLLSQCLEYDADYMACCFCARCIMEGYSENIEMKKVFVREFCFGLYNICILFDETGEKSSFMDCLREGFRNTTHPHPGIRVTYCITVVLAIVAEYIKADEVIRLFNMIAEECISFERILIQHNKLKDCLYALAYTEQGVQHMMFLNNMWNEKVKAKLEPYAKISLQEKETVENMPYWIDENGNFLKREN